jgi:SAM-dependent methyltransferase
MLDFGCGNGEMVKTYNALGFDAYGCDIALQAESDRLRLIPSPYRLPFPDDSFEFVVSNQVFEHVQDHTVAFAEIRRVLRPTGWSLHVFPSRYSLLESHVRVPLGTLLRHPWWLRIWAQLGIRNEFQQGLPPHEVVSKNLRYLTTETNYPRRSELEAAARAAEFSEVRFVERTAIAASNGRLGQLAPLVAHFPALARLYSGVHSRVLFLR